MGDMREQTIVNTQLNFVHAPNGIAFFVSVSKCAVINGHGDPYS